MFTQSRRARRKTDPVFVLVVLVALGMCVTIGYQLSIYTDGGKEPIATRIPPPLNVGG